MYATLPALLPRYRHFRACKIDPVGQQRVLLGVPSTTYSLYQLSAKQLLHKHAPKTHTRLPAMIARTLPKLLVRPVRLHTACKVYPSPVPLLTTSTGLPGSQAPCHVLPHRTLNCWQQLCLEYVESAEHPYSRHAVWNPQRREPTPNSAVGPVWVIAGPAAIP